MAGPVYTHVHLCSKHLRLVFWEHRIWEGYFTGRFSVKAKTNPVNSFTDHTGTMVAWTQSLEYRDPQDGNRKVMDAHWYLDEDMQPAASGHPDPKFIRIGETKHHKWSPGNPPCRECTRIARGWMHTQNVW